MAQPLPSSVAATLASSRYLEHPRTSSTEISSPQIYKWPPVHSVQAPGSELSGVRSVRYVKKRPARTQEQEIAHHSSLDQAEAVSTEHISPTAALIGLFERHDSELSASGSISARKSRLRVLSPTIESPKPLRPLSAPHTRLAVTLAETPMARSSPTGLSMTAANGPPIEPRTYRLNRPKGVAGARNGERQEQSGTWSTRYPELARVSEPYAAAEATGAPYPSCSLVRRSDASPSIDDQSTRSAWYSVHGQDSRSSTPIASIPSRAVDSTRTLSDQDIQHAQTVSSDKESQLARGEPVKISPLALPRNSPANPLSITAQFRRASPVRNAISFMTESSLADAIVASSLATSRAPSPCKSHTPPLLLPQRHAKPSLFSNNHLPRNQLATQRTRTPSPAKPMRHTLRKPIASDEDDMEADAQHHHHHHHHHQRRKRPAFLQKHPHKHHEGTRKRWRDQVTDRERKRYEGVWAANKGVDPDVSLCNIDPTINHHRSAIYAASSPTSSASTSSPSTRHPSPMPDILTGCTTTTTPVAASEHAVLNLVVRDIWSRSRLGPDVLQEVWDLVDRQAIGLLDREEFVVGMWLIDQRLKGRKLPIKVSLSVWDSVRTLSGIKVREIIKS